MGWWWVDTDALPSSSPSLIWLSWGFGLAWAVTIVLIRIARKGRIVEIVEVGS